MLRLCTNASLATNQLSPVNFYQQIAIQLVSTRHCIIRSAFHCMQKEGSLPIHHPLELPEQLQWILGLPHLLAVAQQGPRTASKQEGLKVAVDSMAGSIMRLQKEHTSEVCTNSLLLLVIINMIKYLASIIRAHTDVKDGCALHIT